MQNYLKALKEWITKNKNLENVIIGQLFSQVTIEFTKGIRKDVLNPFLNFLFIKTNKYEFELSLIISLFLNLFINLIIIFVLSQFFNRKTKSEQ